MNREIIQNITIPIDSFLRADYTGDARWYEVEAYVKQARKEKRLFSEVRQAMMPYYTKLFLADECFFRNKEVSNRARGAIFNIMDGEGKDFGRCLNHIDIVACAKNWGAQLRKLNRHACEFLVLVQYLLSVQYSPDWESVGGKIRSLLRKANQYSDYKELEMYCIVMAFLLVLEAKISPVEKRKYYDQIRTEWEFLKYMYSIMLKHIVGTKLQNFAALASTLVNYKEKYPYMHLLYKAFKENFDALCPHGIIDPYTHRPIRTQAKEHLRDMENIIKTTPPSDEITQLCMILFPKKMKDVLEQTRPKTYEELEHDIADLNSRYENIVKKMVAQFSSSVSMEEIEEAFSKFNVNLALSFYSTINTLLAQNETWRKYAPQIQQHILARQEKEKIENTQALAKAISEVAKPTINNTFEKGSCSFMAGSTLNGGVTLNS